MLSWSFRMMGILLVVPALFYRTFTNWFPGLPENGSSYFLIGGLIVYAVGAVLGFFKEKKKHDPYFESEEDV